MVGGAALNAIEALMRSFAAVLPGPDGRLRSRCARDHPADRERGRRLVGPAARGGRARRAGRAAADGTAAAEFFLRTTSEPSVSVNGIESGSPHLQKTVLPVEATANVSIRLALGQSTAEIGPVFEKLLRDAAPAGTTLDVELRSTGEPAYVDPESEVVQLGLDAFEHVLGTRPVLTRSGGSIPVVATVAARGFSAIVTGFSRPTAQMHSPNDKFPGLGARGRARDDRRAVPEARGPLAEAAPRNNGARYASPLAAELADEVLERFLRYVVIDTQASVEDTATYPSSAKQLDLSRLLVDELRAIGLEDAELTEHGYVLEADPAQYADAPGGRVDRARRHVAGTRPAGRKPIVHAN